ncbi:tetratricopeptide repeat protein [Psychrobacter sp. HD31]|uniref:tetratricopeptide repeat protein n=1 Tax=Psychrobacter sp. HD31 TaxID=3112003 RepID=UPI003DA3CD5B
MKAFLRNSLLVAILGTSGIASAELSSNVSLDVSRFDVISVDELTRYAKKGSDQAQFYLAKRLQKGIGVERNTSKAVKWYTKAAEQGVTPAQLNLGMMYAIGDGVKVNEAKARYWLEKAAQRGDNRASFALAMIDEKQEKLVDAYKWYDLSARDGMLDERVRTKARSKIGQLALNLSSSDIADARKKANSWLYTK